MKHVMLIASLVFITSCAQPDQFRDIARCTQAPVSGGTQITCPDGTNSFVANGKDGAQGADANPVTTVQFCPGYAPSSFPEVGFCINGTIYAEYYAPPSSGLVALPLGYYSSTQTSAACNFTVTANCGVTH